MDARTRDLRLDSSRLESLLESAKILGSSLDLREQLNHLMRTVMGRLLVTRALVALRDGEGWRAAAVRGLREIGEGERVDPQRLAGLGLTVQIPIGEGAREAGFLALPPPRRPGWPDDDSEREFLEALLSLASATIENALAHEEIVEANRELARRIHELNTLVELARAFSSTIDPEEIARVLMLTLSGRWTVRRHALLAWPREQAPLKLARNVSDEELARWRALAEGAAEPVRDGEFLLAPLRSGEATIGVVALGAPATGEDYTPEDVEFCAALAAQASVALDNAWRIQDTLYRRQMERELELASAIQRDLFPKRLPEVPGLELAAANRQARLVGGDYYDVLGDARRPLLCVADVAGKGISASLLMATIQATLRALLVFPLELTDLVNRANALLCGSMPGNRYATLFTARYDAASGTLEYVNAAQCEAILARRGGGIELLEATGLPIGMFPGVHYEARRLELAPGDVLVIYSDGVTDAQAPTEEEFGLERLADCVRRLAGGTAQQICDGVLEAVSQFVEETPQYDDITVMVARRVSESE
ncbi:MAG: PP2C family protein-serine/threonine phosphatase [Bryobacteraceae bacterium]|nr:PP2C family protein-serine/threonine phosphatase [Bryobacteraceae bacterium]